MILGWCRVCFWFRLRFGRTTDVLYIIVVVDFSMGRPIRYAIRRFSAVILDVGGITQQPILRFLLFQRFAPQFLLFLEQFPQALLFVDAKLGLHRISIWQLPKDLFLVLPGWQVVRIDLEGTDDNVAAKDFNAPSGNGGMLDGLGRAEGVGIHERPQYS